MSSDSRFSEVDAPEQLLQLDLSAAYYPGPNQSAQEVREALWHLQRENKLQWRVRTFETAAHYSQVLANWTPDIAIAHWHGEARAVFFSTCPRKQPSGSVVSVKAPTPDLSWPVSSAPLISASTRTTPAVSFLTCSLPTTCCFAKLI
jgi:hypothetical protein